MYNKNYSKKLNQYIAKKGDMTDSEFFTSEEYTDFTKQCCLDMITGVCSYLRNIGVKVTEAEEKRRMESLSVYMSAGFPDETAYTNGSNIVINTNCELLSGLTTRELKHFAIQGFRTHEVGHILFTDYPTSIAWNNRLSNGDWYPEPPRHITTPEGAELNSKMQQDSEFRRVLTDLAWKINNAIEDGYIESELHELYGGLAWTELSTLNAELEETFVPLTEQMKGKKSSPLAAVLNQALIYSKFRYLLYDDAPQEYIDMLDEIMLEISNIETSRDPKDRVRCTNELLCILYPLIKDEIDKMQNKQQNGQGQQNGQSGQGAPGSGSGQGQQTLTQKQADALGEMISNAAKNSGASNEGSDHKSNSIFTSAKATDKKKKKNGGAAGKGKDGNGNGTSTDVSSSVGASSGESDLSAELKTALDEVKKLGEKTKQNAAKRQLEREMLNDMKEEAKGSGVSVSRAEKVQDANISAYQKYAEDLLRISRMIEKKLSQIVQDEDNNDTETGLLMGKKFDARRVVKNDGKYFSKSNFPGQTPRLAMGLLCDESGSMCREATSASIKAAIIIEDLCRRMEMPCFIGGFTTGSGGASYISYVEDGSVDNQDKYRLTGMSSRAGTPTGRALEYMIGKLEKIPSKNKLIIVSTDGCSDDKDHVKRCIKKAKTKGITVIGAGIGRSAEQIRGEFGDSFLDLSDIDKMPMTLANICKRYIAN